MSGVVSSPRRVTRIGPFLVMALAVVACVPLSDLDSAASGGPEANDTGGVPSTTGGEGGTFVATTGGSGGGAPVGGGTGGVLPSGGTGSVLPSGGTGGVLPTGATGSVLPTGATGGVEPDGGYGGVSPSGGSGGVEPSGGYGGVEPSGGYGGVEPSGGYGGVEPSGGTGGIEPTGGTGGTGGADGGTGGTGGVQCTGNLRDCDTDPSDCETDITSDPAHCGGCGDPCNEYDECVDSQCVTPCIWETAFTLESPNVDYPVPGNGCVRITQHLAGYYQFLADREIRYTYDAEACGYAGEGVIPTNQGSEPIPACPVVLDLLSTSAEVVIRWWNLG